MSANFSFAQMIKPVNKAIMCKYQDEGNDWGLLFLVSLKN